MIDPIYSILKKDTLSPLKTQFSEGRVLPLGRTKLRACELLQSIVSLKKVNITKAVADSNIMEQMLALVERHPWNNVI